jgi:hypothetical protein
VPVQKTYWIRRFFVEKKISTLQPAPYTPFLSPYDIVILIKTEQIVQRSPFSVN